MLTTKADKFNSLISGDTFFLGNANFNFHTNGAENSSFSIPMGTFFFKDENGDCYVQSGSGKLFKVNTKNKGLEEIWEFLDDGILIEDHEIRSELISVLKSLVDVEVVEEVFSSQNLSVVINQNSTGLFKDLGIEPTSREQQEILLACSAFFNYSYFKEISEQAKHNSSLWIPVFFDGINLRVGPVFGGTICFNCYEKRMLAASRDVDLTKSVWQALENKITPQGLLPKEQLNWLKNNLTLLIEDISQLPLMNHYLFKNQLSLNFSTKEKKLSRILSVPGCGCDKQEAGL
ncbi:hypothetical protein [Mesobacillus thioparans]|uniref:hypothetical protein n=1 Tax=Mesobacillus thioparans TaxID=370439 RepID=UPI0039F03BEE